MISLGEFDLEAPHEPLPPFAGAAWLLVRAGDDVLGEVRFENFDDYRESVLERKVHDRFADRLYARTNIRARPKRKGVRPEDVTVVVCTHDRPAQLEGWLKEADRLDPRPGEILVVDNAPTSDAARSLAERFGVSYELEVAPGLDRARNAGWKRAGTAVVAYVDDDARMDSRYVGSVASAFISPDVAGVTGLILPLEIRTFYQEFFERLEGMRKGFEPRMFATGATSVGFETFRIGAGTNMAFRRRVLESLGGFDPRLDVGTRTRGGGDLDMFYRVLEAGHVMRYEPRAIVRHLHRASRSALLAQMVDWGTGYHAYLAKRASLSQEAARAVRLHRPRWRLRRHVRGVAGALGHRQWLRVPMVVAEMYGSLRGAHAFAYEAARMPGGYESVHDRRRSSPPEGVVTP